MTDEKHPNDDYVAQQGGLSGPVVPPEVFPEESAPGLSRGESASTPGDLGEREKAERKEAEAAQKEAAKSSSRKSS